jgi:uncharacterized repeat protein (TIGR03837 family)
MHYTSIDLFCHVVDNFGDIGFVYRFAREFHVAHPQCKLRVFVDDMKTLHSIDPSIDPALLAQKANGIEFIAWATLTEAFVRRNEPADILVEAFACHIPEPVMKAAESRPRVIINLEHLSAEPWVEGYHLKPSLLPQENLKKYFFMPGFTTATGGIIVDHRIERVRPRLVMHRVACLNGLLNQAGCGIEVSDDELTGTVFTYERGFDTLLADLNDLQQKVLLLVFGDKSRTGMMRTFDRAGGRRIRPNDYQCGNVRAVFVPFITQPRYDALLCCADFNIVRGEDSLVRAIMASRPFVWNAYIQSEKYHKVKVEALLLFMEKYFPDPEVFSRYRSLMMSFNDAEKESPVQATGERYHYFFRNLTKFAHTTREMSYFLARNCDLVKQFAAFISSL